MTDQLSIIITALNEREWLLKTVASIFSSTETRFEIIVIDDASTDGTCEDLFFKHPEVRYLKNAERIGLIRSRIFGAAIASGNYLVFMDAHCKPEPGWDLNLLDVSKKINNRIIAVPAIPLLDGSAWMNNVQQSGYAMTFNRRLDMKWCPCPAPNRDPYLESAIFAGCVSFISKAFYSELQGFDDGLSLWGCENIDLSLRCWMLGGKVIVVPSAIVGHLFKPVFNYSLSKETIITNKLRVAAVNFSETRYQRVVKEFSWVKELPPGLLPRAEMIQERRDYLVAKRVFDDQWVLEKFGVEV